MIGPVAFLCSHKQAYACYWRLSFTDMVLGLHSRLTLRFQVLDEATDSVLSLDVGAYEIATGSADGHARIYDVREGRMFLDFHGDSVTSVHLTSDNQCLLTSCMDGHIRLLEKINGQMLAE